MADIYVFPKPIETRSEIPTTYYFWVIDSAGDIIKTNSGGPPDTIFIDVFTGLPYPASYTVRVQSRSRYHNTDIVYGETIADFELDAAGSVVALPAIPNTPFDLRHELTAGGGVRFDWQYDPSGELVAPTEYVVYIDDVEVDTIPYFRTTTSRGTLEGLPETLTTLKITARSLTGESSGVSITFTPDASAPSSPVLYLAIT